ncbi:MAG: VCBS repeat-containing protein [bacterium]|nr:VCBS repeat-containing protein [bacterium]
MSASTRLLTVLLFLIYCASIPLHGFQAMDDGSAAPGERRVLRNTYGAVIRDAEGNRINYTREQLAAQKVIFQKTKSAAPAVQTDGIMEVPGPKPSWSYAAFGNNIGFGGIAAARLANRTELYMVGGATDYLQYYWYALTYDEANATYSQTFVSPTINDNIVGIKVTNILDDSAKEIVVVLESGRLLFYNQQDKSFLKEISLPLLYRPYIKDLEIADIDSDGIKEFIVATSYDLYVFSDTGTLKWKLEGIAGDDVLAAQMDDDNALEIAVSSGRIIDGITHQVEWYRTEGFGEKLVAGDIDNDGRDELIAVQAWDFIWAFDIERKLPKWSIAAGGDLDTCFLADIDNDSVLELLVGDGQWGEVHAYDTVTQAEEWSIVNPENGVNSIFCCDADNDGVSEVLWAAGEHLYVADWKTLRIEWQNDLLNGPFLGPLFGDLDGDGKEEMVAVSYHSDSYDGGRILVFDNAGHFRALSAPVLGINSYSKIRGLKLTDVDNDGSREILLAADYWHDGVIAIYDFNADNTFTLNWQNATRPSGAGFYSVAAGDIDGDGQMEIVGGTGEGIGDYVYVYNYADGLEEWHSLQHGSGSGLIDHLELADLDNDGAVEIISLVWEGDAHIFNGVTKELDAIIYGDYTALRLFDLSAAVPSIALGDKDGNIEIYRYTAGAYTRVYRQNYGTGAVDGFCSPLDPDWLVFGSSGKINIAASNKIIRTSSKYGATLGRKSLLQKGNALYAGGTYTLLKFNVSRRPYYVFHGNDFDGDNASDIAVFRASEGRWHIKDQPSVSWGTSTDIPVPGDYDGDGDTDIAVYRPSNGRWCIMGQPSTPWGTATDIPVPGDYDGDGDTDIAIYRPSNGRWCIKGQPSIPYGTSEDIPVPADYDGDGDTDIAVYRPSNGRWCIMGQPSIPYGTAEDLPVPADYDGDGDTDIAVFRPSSGRWYIRGAASQAWGVAGDIPVPGDFDGDSDADIAIFRPSTGIWAIKDIQSVQFGVSTDIPLYTHRKY